MKLLWTLYLLMNAALLTAQKSFDRADFYINTNECVNCQMFLPNYAITLENSDTLYIHLDNSTKRFGVKYLESKGINVSKFDSIFYEDLLDKYDGYFDSFIVITDGENTDTVLVKTPLILKSGDADSKYTENLNCGETTNRVTPFIGEQTFILKDYLLEKTFEYYTKSNKITNCDSDPFQVENHTQNYYDYVTSHGLSTSLTQALHQLLVQLNKAKPQVISVSANKKDLFTACIELPYVNTLANGDTAISKLFLLQGSDEKVVGMLQYGSSPSQDDLSKIDLYYPDPANGFIYSSGKLIIGFGKSKPNVTSDNNTKFIGMMDLDSSGYFVLQEIFDFKAPAEFNKQYLSLAFYNNIAYFRRAPAFFNCEDQKDYQFPIVTDSLNLFELYSVTKIPNSTINEFRLIYRLNENLYISIFKPQMNELTEQNQIPINKSQYAIPQKQGVFIFTEGGPSLPYQFISYKEKL